MKPPTAMRHAHHQAPGVADGAASTFGDRRARPRRLRLLGVIDVVGEPLVVVIEQRVDRPSLLGLRWRRRGSRTARRSRWWTCRASVGRPGWCGASTAGSARRRACPVGSWTGEDARIAAPRMGLTDRAGRWATSRSAATAARSARSPTIWRCDWHTVNDAVIAYGTALVDDPGPHR